VIQVLQYDLFDAIAQILYTGCGIALSFEGYIPAITIEGVTPTINICTEE
jgi:hypothetical protein